MWKIDVCGMTDIGKKRPRNEDHFLVASLSKTLEVSHTSLQVADDTRLFGNSQGHLLLVADGMGGHAAGDRASEMVVQAFADYALNMLRWYFRADPTRDADLTADLRDAVIRCQRDISSEVCEHPEERGMGATLTLAYVIWPRMFVVHVGDSRCYLMRDGKLKQLTRDHTMAQLLADSTQGGAQQTPEQIPQNRWQHVLWNAVGGSEEEPQPDIFRVDLEFDDRLLLCTDGLSNHVPDTGLSQRLLLEQTALEICRQLIEDANAAGGSDNITAVVAKFPKPHVIGDSLEIAAAVVAKAEPREGALSDTADYKPSQPAVVTA